MSISTTFYEDPARVLAQAGAFLSAEPVLHNLVLTLLRERTASPEPGRYWVAVESGAVRGVVLQSPHDRPANVTPMAREVVASMVDAIAEAGVVLPGVNGDAATAAAFAGLWTERRKCAALPYEGIRLYEALEFDAAPTANGRLRQAVESDLALVLAFMRGFFEDIGEPGSKSEIVIAQRLSAGLTWLWEDGEPVSLVAHSLPVEGVTRIQAAYSPPAQRNRGYGAACVGALTGRLRGLGYRPILYTDLGNPVSNSVFRRIGYRALAENLRYRFR